MGLFPGALPAAGTASASATLAAAGHTSLHNTGADEARAIATKVGTGSSTPAANQSLIGTGAGTSSWGLVSLTAGVTGVLPVANGGTGLSSLAAGIATFLGTPTSANLLAALTDETGTGSAVFGTSPTIGSPTLTTPTIASFVNANHDHTAGSGGGLLGFGALISTIFSSQLQTQVNAGSAGGNMWWINLGGIKILWGLSASKTSGTGDLNYDFTLPAFFTTVSTAVASPCGVSTDGRQYANVNILNTVTATVTVVAAAAASTKIGIVIFGT